MLKLKFLANMILTLFIFIILIGYFSISEARIISIVYDDSGSMQKEERWIYANYSIQTLVSLLNQNDTILYVKMSSDKDRWEIGNERDKKLKTIQEWKKPLNNVSTPYMAVLEASKQLLNIINEQTQQAKSKDKDEQNWLIITTDGQFICTKDENDCIEEDIKNLVKNFIDKTDAKVKVAFILIGASADQKVPNWWKEESERVGKSGLVEILKANSNTIDNEMRKVAALISGRDYDAAKIKAKGNELSFDSEFPLKKIIILQQEKKNDYILKVQRIEVPKLAYTINSYDIKLPNNKLFGSITHIGSSNLMPEGTYSIYCSENVENKNIAVFFETAIDFKTTLKNPETNQEIPKAILSSPVCKDTKIKIEASFFKSDSDEAIIFNKNMLSKIEVSAFLNGNKILLNHESGNLFSTIIQLGDKEYSLSMQAKYPKYFHLKSEIFTIKGKKCAGKGDIISGADKIEVPYIFSKSPILAAKSFIKINQSGDKTNQLYSFEGEVFNIPEGIILKLNGQEIAKKNSKFELKDVQTGVPIHLEIFRNQQYREQNENIIKIKLKSKNSMLELNNDETIFKICPKPRAITIESKCAKEYLINELDGIKSKLNINLKADGKDISFEEFKEWKIISIKTDCRVGFNIERDDNKTLFLISPRYFFNTPCFTQTGKLDFDLSAAGPFPIEPCNKKIEITVSSASLWIKCGSIIKVLLLFILIIIWIIGIIVKPRFKTNSSITYASIRIRKSGGQKSSNPDTQDLSSNFIFRWLIPYIPETKSIWGKTFKAGKRGKILLPKDQQNTDTIIKIDGTMIDNPGVVDIHLSKGSEVNIETDNLIDLYKYN